MPYNEDFDPTQLDSGLPSDFDATILDPEFLFDPEIQNGEAALMSFALIDIDDPDVADQFEPMDMKVKCGKGWEPAEGGSLIVREDGRIKNFHQNSAMGLMIASLVENDVDVRDLCKAKDAMPNEAAFWSGLRCHWVRKSIDYGDYGKRDRLLPVSAEIDTEGVKAAPKTATKAAPAPAKKAVAKKAAPKADVDNVSVSGVTLAADVYQTIFDLAYNAADEDSFRSDALESFSDNDEALVAIMDEETDSIWERAATKWNADNAGE